MARTESTPERPPLWLAYPAEVANVSLGEKIWSQDEFAYHAQIDGRQVSRYENNRVMPSLEVVVKMAKVLGVRIEQMLEGEIPETRRAGPVGKVQKIFEQVSTLPRRQQDRVIETVSALVTQYKRGA